MPCTTLYRYIKNGVLKNTRSVVNPISTPRNKIDRVAYAESFVEADGCFSNLEEEGHLDEKWWFQTREATGYIIVDGEDIPPDRKVKHKSHINKVMALTFSFRPRPDPDTGEWWDEKIGIWFSAEQVAAQRKSRNRPAGTLEQC